MNDLIKNAKSQYIFAKSFYEELIEKDGKDSPNAKVALAQVNIYAGIYNKNKKMYEKGVKNFDKYTMMNLISFIQLRKGGESVRQIRISQESTTDMLDLAEEITCGDEAIKGYVAFMKKKQQYYKEEMPILLRGHFKTNEPYDFVGEPIIIAF